MMISVPVHTKLLPSSLIFTVPTDLMNLKTLPSAAKTAFLVLIEAQDCDIA